MKKIVCAALMLISISTLYSQNAIEKKNVDEKIFPNILWGTEYMNIIEIFGEPSSDFEDDNYWHLIYPGFPLGEINTALMLNINKIEKTLEGIQIVTLESYLFPYLYFRDYSNIEDFLDKIYPSPIDQGFDWYSPIKEPQFTGEEIVNKQLAMISTRDIGNTIVAHSIMSSEDQVNHFISFVTTQKRDRFLMIDEFANAFNQIINE